MYHNLPSNKYYLDYINCKSRETVHFQFLLSHSYALVVIHFISCSKFHSELLLFLALGSRWFFFFQSVIFLKEINPPNIYLLIVTYFLKIHHFCPSLFLCVIHISTTKGGLSGFLLQLSSFSGTPYGDLCQVCLNSPSIDAKWLF